MIDKLKKLLGFDDTDKISSPIISLDVPISRIGQKHDGEILVIDTIDNTNQRWDAEIELISGNRIIVILKSKM